MILEQLKNSVPEHVATYISENKMKTSAEAARLVDDYILTHSRDGWNPGTQGGSGHRENSFAPGTWPGWPVKHVAAGQRY